MPSEGNYDNPISGLFPQMNGSLLFPPLNTEQHDRDEVRSDDDEHRDQRRSQRSSIDTLPSLSSNIINQIARDIDVSESDRFKYYTEYEKINVNTHNNQLLAEEQLTQMNDFQKYDIQTRLNDIIQEKVYMKQQADLTNNFQIIAPDILSQNFIGEFENEAMDKKKYANWIKRPNIRIPKPVKLRHILHNAVGEFPQQHGMQEQVPLHDSQQFVKLKLESTPSNSSVSTLLERQPPLHNVLHRNLKARHLQMIAFGGTLGVGLFLNSGKCLSIGGPLGALLGFSIAGLIVLATMVSFCEMVTLISVADGVSGMGSRFVDDAFGFAVGWLYFLSFAIGLPAEIIAGCIMLGYYNNLNIPGRSTAGWVFFFLIVIVFVNLLDIRVFGEIEYISSLIKLIITFVLVVMMIVLNRGGLDTGTIGFKYWENKRQYSPTFQTYGPFRPSFDLQDSGQGSLKGIGGAKGRFLAVIACVLTASYALSGTEIVCIAAIEAKNPRKALPSATKRVFWRIVFFYCISIFCVGLNVYAGDSRLSRYYTHTSQHTEVSENNTPNQCRSGELQYAGFATGNQSPWIIAFQNANYCNFSSVLNGFLVFFALSAGISQVYVASRTLYSISIQKKAPSIFSLCNRYGVPYYAVLVSGSFGLLGLLSINHTAAVVFQNMTNIIATSGILAWFSMNLSFLRFYYALKLRHDIISRKDRAYPYKSPFQPFTAYFGLFGCGSIILLMGYVVFLHDEWDTLFFFTSYGSVIIFFLLYFGYKYVRRSRFLKVDQLDLDSGRRELDRIIWDEEADYSNNFSEWLNKAISFLA